jgi:hypothetical protein
MPLTINADTTEWITVDEVKRHANITTSTSDDEVELMRDAAQDAVEGLIGPVLWRTVTQRISANDSTLVLNTTPVLSVTSLTLSGSPATYTVIDGGMLADVTARGDVVATYVAGRTVVPGAVRLAALIIAAHLWQTQLGSAPTQLQDGFNNEPTVGLGYAIPNRAADLLAPYLLLPGVA